MTLLFVAEINGQKFDVVELGEYKDGSKAIQLISGEPYTTLTINLGYGPEKPGHYLVKTWGCNTSICSLLLEYGYFWDTGIRRYGDHVVAAVWAIQAYNIIRDEL